MHLASFLCMETMKQGVFLPSETKHDTSIQEPVPELAEVSQGNFLLQARGAGVMCTLPAREHVISSALATQTWKAQNVALSHRLCKSHWHEMN